jgi:hypothetical protein
MLNRPKLPDEIVITNVAIGSQGSSSGAKVSSVDAIVTPQIVGDKLGVFAISRIETLELVREPDGLHGSILVWEPGTTVKGSGPIQVEQGEALRAFVTFTPPPDPAVSVFRASVNIGDLGAIPIFATANLGRLEFAVVSNPLILPGQTQVFEFVVVSSLAHEVSGLTSIISPQFSSSPTSLTVAAGGTLRFGVSITCAQGTSPGDHAVFLHLRSLDNSRELGSTEIVIAVTRSVEVVASLPSSFGTKAGSSIRCVIRATVSGGPARLEISAGPLPRGLTVNPPSQSVPVDGAVFVGLDIDVDPEISGELAFTIVWTVQDPQISGELPFNLEVIEVPQALLFPSTTLGPSTVTANANWVLMKDGFHIFTGNIHESGVLGHEYGFGMALNVTDANGVGFGVVHSGSIGPKLPFGDPDDAWRDIHFDQRIADNWDIIADPSTRARAGLNVDSRVLLGILDALSLPAIAVLGGFVGSHVECDDPTVGPTPPPAEGESGSPGITVKTR